MTEIVIKEEGGCELYVVYINGKKVIDGLSGNDTIDVNNFPDGTLQIDVNGEAI